MALLKIPGKQRQAACDDRGVIFCTKDGAVTRYHGRLQMAPGLDANRAVTAWITAGILPTALQKVKL